MVDQNEKMASGSRVHRIMRRTKWTFIALEVFAAGMLIAILIDVVFSMGWGFHAKDIWGALAFMIFYPIVYAFCVGTWKLTGLR